jgi:hypothetical protein
MELKSGYSLYEVNRGKVHIQRPPKDWFWHPTFLCGLGFSASDKKLSKNNVVETGLCKVCLKRYRRK